ncbi:hypothetical protein H8S90_10950 [Olivibacter sp. SDN3]|uniref:hypothetical protein n=1 Tax=Olivibacter sp. SDN3 TaxID=2764720 RepID=UPI0016515499|nr:hypothetical protein [Olivibacter sp. SDN3]QNL52040.1 hypothetical protein H8S90_10950 [Olivibacter sp. SDN3]
MNWTRGWFIIFRPIATVLMWLTMKVTNASYSDDRFGDARKALSLGCKCGLSDGGLRNVYLGLDSPEGAMSIWMYLNDLDEINRYL